MTDWSPDLERLKALDDAEWLRVEQTYCGRLFAYAQRRTGDLQASEDVLQETLLGAVRGITDFDASFTFEQYLFGICRNRTIDFLRRRKPRTLEVEEDSDGFPGIEALAQDTETPSGIVRGMELSGRARELLGDILRDWVEETWAQKEFVRLSVVEALFSGGWRNRDTWRHFDLRDETAVAGIKFRALKRLRQLAAVRDSGGELLRLLEQAAAEGAARIFDVDVREVWRERRVSCPARHWIARYVARTLDAGASGFLAFHLEEMKCPWCQANYDDLVQHDRADGEELPGSGQESTLRILRPQRAE